MKNYIKYIFSALMIFGSDIADAQSLTPAIPAIQFIVRGSQSGDKLGASVACLGTFGTGVGSDVSVGAPGAGANGQGSVIQVQGDTGAFINSYTSPSTGFNVNAGTSVASVGDADGDGQEDVLFGAPGDFSLGGFLGKGPGPNVINLPRASVASNSLFGAVVAGFNSSITGSGPNNFIVSAPGHDNSSLISAGAFYLFHFPSASPAVLRDFLGESTGEFLGASVSAISDVDGDGFADIIAGAPGFQTGQGIARVYSSSGGSAIVSVTGDNSEDGFGSTVANLGDLDGNGKQEYAVAAPGGVVSSLGGPVGYVNVYSGEALLSQSATLLCRINGEFPGDQTGFAMAGLGDINGDGKKDFLISRPGAMSETGIVDIYTYDNGSCIRVFDIPGSNPGVRFGVSLSGINGAGVPCNLNNDGVDDFVVGSEDDLDPNLNFLTDAGAAIGFVGQLPPPPPPTPTMTPTETPTVVPTFTPSPTPTATPVVTLPPPPPLPKSVKLSYKISKEGELVATVRFDIDPADSCKVTLQGRTTDKNLKGKRPIVDYFVDKTSQGDTMRFRARDLFKAKKAGLKNPHVLHLLATARCGPDKVRIDSRVASRFLICGATPPLGITDWETDLLDKIR